MTDKTFLGNLDRLHHSELCLRKEALAIIQGNLRLTLHLDVTERAMTVAKVVIADPREDQDFKVIKMLSARMFNAFGASLNLLLSGYHQKSAMIMRDVMETMFLMDLFVTDHATIERWRCTNDNKSKREFFPAEVRKTLDARDGDETGKRGKAYKMLCELATHPTLGTQYMIRPEKDSDMLVGPFMGDKILRQGLEQLGVLAVQAGAILDAFLPEGYEVEGIRESSALIRERWLEAFSKQASKHLHATAKVS